MEARAVTNKDANGAAGKPCSAGDVGYSCIAEIRMIETIEEGTPKHRSCCPETPYELKCDIYRETAYLVQSNRMFTVEAVLSEKLDKPKRG